MSFKRNVLCSLLLFVCASCLPSSVESPRSVEIVTDAETRPAFVSNVFAIEQERMCVEVDQGEIWEPGNEAEELSQHIQANVELTLDNQSISSIKPIYSWLTLRMMHSENGEYLGSYGGEMTICYDIKGLSLGLHSSTVTIPTTSGVEHSYSWEFRVVEDSTVEARE